MNIQPANRQAIIERPATEFGTAWISPRTIRCKASCGRRRKGNDVVPGDRVEGQMDPVLRQARADTVVYEVPGDAVKKVQAVLGSKLLLRDRTVLHLQMPRVDAIDIDVGADKVELRRVAGVWYVYDAEGKGRPAKSFAITELLNRLGSPQLATSFPPPGVPDDKMGFTKPRAEVKIWEGGIAPDLKADPKLKPKLTAAPTVRLLIGIQDVGDVVLARRLIGEAKAYFHLPAEVLTLISRGRLDYVDGTINPYGADPEPSPVHHRQGDIRAERPDDKQSCRPRLRGRLMRGSPRGPGGRPA